MGGRVDWQAIPYVFHMLGVDDPDRIIRQLLAMKSHMERVRNAG